MVSMGEIFRSAFPGYAASRRLRPDVWRAASAIMTCRTSALGGHKETCPEGHYIQSHYNSCHHRACPQCHGLQMERWLRGKVARYALDCPMYHVVFTVPKELRVVWQWNRSLFGDLLFAASSESLLTLLRDRRHLGATPGMVGSLHTWNRRGDTHVHTHFLVTAGGWTADGWRSCPDGFFVPYQALRQLFRGKLLASLRSALSSGELTIPAGMDRAALVNELNRLGRVEWHVKVMDRYDHGQGVLIYFSRYVRGGPVKSPQIESWDGRALVLRYRQHETGQIRRRRMTATQFFDVLLQHVPAKGFRGLRYYGVFAPGCREQLAQCRACLGMADYAVPEPLSVDAYLEWLSIERVTHCPTCGRRLEREEIPRPRARGPTGLRAVA